MKNKKLSWFLLPAVLCIWGVIGWKVYAAVGDDEDIAAPENELHVTSDHVPAIPDTYNLQLDYRDPFLDKPVPVKMPKKNSSAPIPPKIEKKETVVAVWPVLRYAGLVKQSKDGKLVGFLNVNGVSHFVKSTDVIDELVIGKVWSDSVEVRRGKERRVITK